MGHIGTWRVSRGALARDLLTLAAMLAAAVLVDLVLAVVYAHFPDDRLVRGLAPAFPVSYKNWLMWTAFAPAVLWLVRALSSGRHSQAGRVGLSIGLAVLLASAHSTIEMWMHHGVGTHTMAAGEFLSYHLFHGLLTYSAVFAVALLIESDRAARERERREARLKEQVGRAQLQTLRMQLQPHFLFNTLNSISALVEEDVGGGQKMIGQLSDFLRLTLLSADHQEVPLREELRLLDAYLSIQTARFGDRLRVEFEVEEAALEARVPNLLVQPLVENAIQHGIQPSLAGGIVRVCAYREDDRLVIEVLDDGMGFEPGRGSGTGVGLRNTRERLRGCYGERACLDVQRRVPAGTAALLRLPWSTSAALEGALR